MKELLKQLQKKKGLGFFIDMGYELYIYEGDPENPTNIYEGNSFDFIEKLMEHFDVRDDR